MEFRRQEPEVGVRFIEPARKVAKKHRSDKSDPYKEQDIIRKNFEFLLFALSF